MESHRVNVGSKIREQEGKGGGQDKVEGGRGYR